ncbi:hypothetical protein [Mesorhizobium sp. dw_380]|uniref:hypothetical protein n=1 Tax=Mesorhizobium sp. dw_380 TaxID=2812001 RepID=UPI003329086F
MVIADHDDAALVLLAPHHFGRREASRAAADNDDLVGHLASASVTWLRRRPLEFLAHEYLAILLFHRPASEWIEGRRSHGLACA